MLRCIAIFILSLVVLSGCYDNHKEPSSSISPLHANCKISKLKELCANGSYTITSDIVCVGRVTTSDSGGNFYRSMFVEDSSGAVEVKLGIYDISTQYPVGLTVALHLKGAAVMLKGDIAQVGLPPQSYDKELREFEAQEIIDRFVVRSSSVEPIIPMLCSPSSLHTALCGRLVRVNSLHYAPLDDDKVESYYRFVDDGGRAVFVYISPYADFVTMQIPTSEVAVQGILYYESVGDGLGKQYVIKPRYENDISPIDSDI